MDLDSHSDQLSRPRKLTSHLHHKSHPQRLQHLRFPRPINPLHPLRRPRIQILRQHILPLRLNHPMPLPGSPHPHPQPRHPRILQQAQHILQGLTPPLRQLLLHDGKLQPSQARPLPRLQRREEPLDVVGGAVVPLVEIEAVDGEGDRGGFLVDLSAGEEQVRVDGADEAGVVGRLGGHVEGGREREAVDLEAEFGGEGEQVAGGGFRFRFRFLG